jgi:hypothetical protein
MQNNQHTLSFLHTAARLMDTLGTLDAIHTAASHNTLDTLNERGREELVGWLHEIAFVANETIAELDTAQPRQAAFRVMKGGQGGDGDSPAVDDPRPTAERSQLEVLVAPRSSYVMRSAGS